jgi:hypothetical protein
VSDLKCDLLEYGHEALTAVGADSVLLGGGCSQKAFFILLYQNALPN